MAADPLGHLSCSRSVWNSAFSKVTSTTSDNYAVARVRFEAPTAQTFSSTGAGPEVGLRSGSRPFAICAPAGPIRKYASAPVAGLARGHNQKIRPRFLENESESHKARRPT